MTQTTSKIIEKMSLQLMKEISGNSHNLQVEGFAKEKIHERATTLFKNTNDPIEILKTLQWLRSKDSTRSKRSYPPTDYAI